MGLTAAPQGTGPAVAPAARGILDPATGRPVGANDPYFLEVNHELSDKGFFVAAADDLIKHVTDETVASAQKIFSRMDSVGQQRMAQLHGGRRDQLEISPNLWAGVGLVRGGAGTALVGNPETVAARIKEYQDLGIDTFIMSGYPHLEEAYRFAELVFPLLKLEEGGNVTRLRVNTGPFGETIGNEYRPHKQVAES